MLGGAWARLALEERWRQRQQRGGYNDHTASHTYEELQTEAKALPADELAARVRTDVIKCGFLKCDAGLSLSVTQLSVTQ